LTTSEALVEKEEIFRSFLPAVGLQSTCGSCSQKNTFFLETSFKWQ